MRLGARKTVLKPLASGSMSVTQKLYGGADEILERHRHRYEVNPDMITSIEAAGLEFVGRDESGMRMEVFELPRSVHPYYIGTQYHPEYLSRPLSPSSPFLGLILAASGQLEERLARCIST
jgi:CTP synthase